MEKKMKSTGSAPARNSPACVCNDQIRYPTLLMIHTLTRRLVYTRVSQTAVP